MADIKWIKIATDIFDNRKIKIIENMPEGDALLVTWFKLLCLAGVCNDDGQIYITKELPYTDESLSVVLGKPLITTRLALTTFQQFGMLELVDDIYRLSNWEKYQNIDGMELIKKQTRERVARHRAKKKQMLLEESNATVTLPVTEESRNVTQENKKENKILDLDIEEDITTTTTNIEGCCCSKKDIFTLWNENMIPITPIIAEKLQDMIENYGEPIVRESITESSIRGKRTIAYVEGVARNKANGTGKPVKGSGSYAQAFDELLGGSDGKDN